MSIAISWSMNSIETPELKFLTFDTPGIVLVTPCMFYKRDAKELAIARKLSFHTTVLFTVGTPRSTVIKEEVKDALDKKLSNGDKVIFNYVTGDIVIKNGDKQIKEFELYPYKFTFDDARVCLGICYNDDKSGNDEIVYYYPVDAEKINLVYTLSCIKRRKFLFSEGDSPTRLGLSIAANLFPVFLDEKDPIRIDYSLSRNFKPNIYNDLESLSPYDDLILLGDKVKEELEEEEKKKPNTTITPRYDDDYYDEEYYARHISGIETSLDRENKVEIIPVTNPITNPITNGIINGLVTGESQQFPLLDLKDKEEDDEEPAWFLKAELEPTSKEKEEEKYRESRTFVKRNFVSERRKVPLTEILNKHLDIHKFPVDVDIDICLQPAVLKKIEWVEQKTLRLFVTDTTKLSEEVMTSFVGFDLEFEED